MKSIKIVGLLLFCLFSVFAAFGQSGFVDVSQSSGLQHWGYNRIQMGGGSAWFDYDGDGDEDIITVGGLGDNKLWRNNGNGTFTDVTAAAGLSGISMYDTQGVVTGDIDNDGFREIFVSTIWHQPNLLFRNNGNGTFSDISVSSGVGLDSMWVSSAAFGDFDGDGLLDLYRGNYVWLGRALQDSLGNYIGYAHRCNPNSLFHNNGDGTFTDLAAQYLVNDTGCALAVVFTDYDGDHDQDILFANDFGAWVAPSGLLQNAYPAPYNDVSVQTNMDARMYGMGIAVGDYDHDLDLDYYVTDIGPNALFQQQSNHTFLNVANSAGVLNDSTGPGLAIGWGDAWIDYDNDMWEDLFISNGYIQLIPLFVGNTRDPDKMYKNLGNGSFADVGMSIGLQDTNAGRGMSMADYDKDGDMDIFVNVVNFDSTSFEPSRLYRNEINNGNHWLQVQLQGTYSNRDAFGSQMMIKVGTEKWLHEVSGGSSHMSQNSSIAHFGMAGNTIVDSLWVIWPTGNVQLLTQLTADQRILVVEDSALFMARPEQKQLITKVVAYPNPFSESIQVEFELRGSSKALVEVFDNQGVRVASANFVTSPGQKTSWKWDGNDFSGRKLPSGMYSLILRVGNEIQPIRVVKQN